MSASSFLMTVTTCDREFLQRFGTRYALFNRTMSDIFRAFTALFLSRTDSTAEEDKPQTPAEPVQEKKHTILAIDDDPTFLHTVTAVLRGRGFNVLTSSTGAKGLNML